MEQSLPKSRITFYYQCNYFFSKKLSITKKKPHLKQEEKYNWDRVLYLSSERDEVLKCFCSSLQLLSVLTFPYNSSPISDSDSSPFLNKGKEVMNFNKDIFMPQSFSEVWVRAALTKTKELQIVWKKFSSPWIKALCAQYFSLHHPVSSVTTHRFTSENQVPF